MLRSLTKAETLIALGMMALALYFMVLAAKLPIGWNGQTGGPGGGAFPFWLSLIILIASGVIALRSIRAGAPDETQASFFDRDMLGSVIGVTVALVVTIALIPVIGAYLALPLFLVWYLRFFGRHGWGLTLILALATPLVVFFFFEVALRILMPKGVTEPLFIPLYRIFF